MAPGIGYLDGPHLARSMFAAADWIAAGREEINRINVFPVPDGDTGTNLSWTLRAVADALQALGDAPLPDRVGRARGRDAVLRRVLSLVDERRRTALPAGYQTKDCFVSLATGVLGTPMGPGAWAVCYQVEDPPAAVLDG